MVFRITNGLKTTKAALSSLEPKNFTAELQFLSNEEAGVYFTEL